MKKSKVNRLLIFNSPGLSLKVRLRRVMNQRLLLATIELKAEPARLSAIFLTEKRKSWHSRTCLSAALRTCWSSLTKSRSVRAKHRMMFSTISLYIFKMSQTFTQHGTMSSVEKCPTTKTTKMVRDTKPPRQLGSKHSPASSSSKCSALSSSKEN